jgi:HSP20 family protein
MFTDRGRARASILSEALKEREEIMASTLVQKEKADAIRPFFDDFFTTDPFRALTSARSVFNSLLDSTLRPEGYMIPAMDLYSKDGTYVVEVALPGFDKKDVNIGVEGNCLTVSGKYFTEETENDKRYLYRELRKGSFSRSVTLPENIDFSKVFATFDAGILKIIIPSQRPAESKKIAIK